MPKTAEVGAKTEIKVTVTLGTITKTATLNLTASEAVSEIDPPNPAMISKFGEVVDYGVDLGTDANGNPLTWKIFYDDKVNVYLIASDYVKTDREQCPALATAIDAIGANKSGNNAIYWNSSNTFKMYKTQNATESEIVTNSNDLFSNTAPDGTKYLIERGLLSFWYDKVKTTASEKPNAKMTACLMDTKAWSGFVASSCSTATNYDANNCYAIGGPTLSLWVESWNALLNKQTYQFLRYNNCQVDGYTCYATGLRNKLPEPYNKLFYPRNGDMGGYYLVSPQMGGAIAGNGVCYVYEDGRLCKRFYNVDYYAVRPVVCLPSNVTISSEKNANNLWDSLVSFSQYAFNKSHATAYAMVSYQTAYLKYYYPNYYMCAVLNNASVKKLKGILYECKEMGINVLLPDINRSYENFENSGDDIVYGYTRIKGVKNKITPLIEEKKNNGYFMSFKDFVRRTRCSDKLVQPLVYAGCFDGFRKGMRTSYLMAYNDIISILDNIDKTNEQIIKLEKNISESKRTKKSDLALLEELKNKLKMFEYEYDTFTPSVDIEDNDVILEEERELLGAYVSGHPLDLYDNYYKSGKSTLISDIEDIGNIICAGIIKDLRVVNRKTDNAELAFFTLEDVSGSIEVCCFTKQYAVNNKYIKENNVIEIIGKIFIDDNDNMKLSVDKISEIKPFKNPIYISIPSKEKEDELEQILQNYIDDTGHPIVLHYQDSGRLIHKDIFINKSFIYNAPDYVYTNELYT